MTDQPWQHSPPPSPPNYGQPGPLSLVEECRGSALIGRELHNVAPPALLCHKEPCMVASMHGKVLLWAPLCPYSLDLILDIELDQSDSEEMRRIKPTPPVELTS